MLQTLRQKIDGVIRVSTRPFFSGTVLPYAETDPGANELCVGVCKL
jgi:hypothetical protein